MFEMKDVEGLGGSLSFGGAVFWVQYKGQTKRRFHCQSTEHEATKQKNVGKTRHGLRVKKPNVDTILYIFGNASRWN